MPRLTSVSGAFSLATSPKKLRVSGKLSGAPYSVEVPHDQLGENTIFASPSEPMYADLPARADNARTHRTDRRSTMTQPSPSETHLVQGVLVDHPEATLRRAVGTRRWGPKQRLRAASAKQVRPRGSPKASFRIVRSTFLHAAARQLPRSGRRPGFPGPRTGSSRAPHGRLRPRGEAERVFSFVPSLT